jgi:hypothetical protein
MQFLGSAPYLIISFRQAIPAAPAPLTTTLISFTFLLIISRAFMRPARQTIAVPC